ncbi:Asparagine synthetase (glutamine-hydrolyzing) [Methanosarcina sp. Kolksee]|uniref:asparagine synthetase B family protein n=1 Tax=Methanosarcina sp. Kolksee TaxID=1434099 RepID=UPI000615FBBE|nr:asparagine synthetase B [Methanosarcina sp. Kolksee]AKB46924.1 Asparagine synthetase (glutamine-hydrolyzing) [Methanosarcina sp. Kolksee]
MCGIAGAAGTPDTNEETKRMLAALEHRGPDACGTYEAKGLSIGNTLLKITGDMPQPLVGKGALVLNGEIFNFRELAAEQGIKTDSDTELLFALIETKIKEGETPTNAIFSVLSRVNGDYALAYALDNELVLARDPVGVKPLFYSLEKGAEKPKIAFASEKKAFFQGNQIKLFPPGRVMAFNIRNGGLEEKSLTIEPPQERISEEHEAASRLRTALEKAVEIRLTKTAGIAFSGGIDSTFLAALAKNIDPSISLYAVGLPNSHDLAQAQLAAEIAGMSDSLKTHLLSPEEIKAAIPDVIYSTESTDPMKIAIGLPLYFVAKTAKEDGKRVLLTGQGADELFGGYSRHEGFLEQGPEVLDRAIYSDLKNISTINLERDDMVTMANSVELRVPFLDKEVIKTGLAISPELKVLKRDSLYIRKYILRKAADSLLPSELLWKEKKAIQYGTGVQKILDRLAREAGFSKKEGNHIEKYLKQVAEDEGFDFIFR